MEENRSEGQIFPSSGGGAQDDFQEFAPIKSKVRFFINNKSGNLRLVSDPDERQSIREYASHSGSSVLIAAGHLVSKLRAEPDDQYFAARRFRSSIESAEKIVRHDRTVVIGDMNMNPFEPGMVAADGLHGMMTKAIVSKSTRTVQGQDYTFFYNPMWSRLGDESQGPAGTYYHGPQGVFSPYWHTFDQALLRPSLIPAYTSGQLEVITAVGGVPLLNYTKIKPSDHLPLLLRLNM